MVTPAVNLVALVTKMGNHYIFQANIYILPPVNVKKGEQELPGLFNTTVPRRCEKKCASKIHKPYKLTKDNEIHNFVVLRPVPIKKDNKSLPLNPLKLNV